MFKIGSGSMSGYLSCEFAAECVNAKDKKCPTVSVVTDNLDDFKPAKSAGLMPERVPKSWYGGPGGTGEEVVRVTLCDKARREERLIEGLRSVWPAAFIDDEEAITASREVEALLDGDQDIDGIVTEVGMYALDRITNGEDYIHPYDTKLTVIDGAIEAICIYTIEPDTTE